MGRAVGRKGNLYFDISDISRRAAAYRNETDRTRGWCYANFFSVPLSAEQMDAVGRHFYLGGIGRELPCSWRPAGHLCPGDCGPEDGSLLLTSKSQHRPEYLRGYGILNPV